MKKILDKIKHWLIKYFHKFSYTGLFVAMILTAYSLSPSLLPRQPLFQGLLAGVVFAVGYGIGCFIIFLWKYLELPRTKGKWRQIVHIIFAVLGLSFIIYALVYWTYWQNSILSVMDQTLIASHQSLLIVFLIMIVLAPLLIAIGRLINKGFKFLIKQMHKFIPRRFSNFIGFVLALIIFALLVDGVLFKWMYDITDSAAAQLNNLTEKGVERPTDSNKVGSDASLIDWETLGREGRNFIVNGPSAQDISEFTGQEAQEPIRIYVGLLTKETAKERAELVLEEMKRLGAFDKSVLLLSTPTGTGWMDPYAVNTVEYIYGGDIANVTMQYSYLSSQATVFFYPERATESANVLFHEVYTYWSKLPQDNRPKLYLFGLSLGAYGTESSTKLYEIMYDPIDGALLTGPPFLNKIHKDITKNRNPGSPAWLPTFGDGSLVRFTALKNNLDNFQKDWGKMRIIYLQYSSDPMVFFEPTMFFHEPEWLKGERGPDVSPYLKWRPAVTFFQVLFDMMVSVSGAPLGYGHNYSPDSYIDSWVELLDPPSWTDEMTERLKEKFLAQ
jgi:uncharacterized membrane protein